MTEFVHLHNHTHYSILDATCTPKTLIKAAKESEHKALALTDHGVMYGCYEFYKYSCKEGIKPIIGYEAYVANGSRFDKTANQAATKKKNYFHLVLLAKNEIGYRNLIKLTSYAHTEGYYYKPRIDEDLLREYSEGIIASSACMVGVINAHLVQGDYQTAYDKAVFYKEVFGDDFYIELQNHNLPEDQIILEQAPKIARELGIKLLATNDVHYIKQDHAIAHNVLLNIRKDANPKDTGPIDIYKLRYRTPEMYYKSTELMIELFKDFPDAIENSMEITDKCEFAFQKKFYMPEFPIPESSNAKNLDELLEERTFEGLKDRFDVVTDEIKERIKYELDVITSMKFPGYFLIVQDFIKAAKELGVSVGPGRGSAAGSLVAYLLGITNINPLPYDLLFERFLNPERISMPDIDIDFSDEKRSLVIDYVKNKYGESSVSQIITFNKLSSKAVLKDVGRVLGIHYSEINLINSKIPTSLGKVLELEKAIELPELKPILANAEGVMKQLIEYSLLLEGLIRNPSIHAAGVVIAPGDLVKYVPLYQKSGSNELASQYSMKDLEEAGLLKMDFLGLRTLSIIDNTLEMIEKNYGLKIDIDKIDFADDKTYEIFSNGSTLAVFQFESKGMQDYLRQLKPKNLEELTAMNALYRPGPMENIPDYIDRKFGRKPIEYLHPLMEKSLKATYGIIVYQEQVMQLARDIAGYSLGQADILRRAMGKKDQAEMEKQKPIFIEGALKNDVSKKIAEEIYELINKFANYGFNKSHALAYSYLAYQTAWLKANYTSEFLAANMSAEMNDLDKIVSLIEEAKNFGYDVLAPDVNMSQATFYAKNNKIYFGLAAIKNVGVSVNCIIDLRLEKPFSSFFDFVARLDNKLVNKRVLESLVCAGAFDSLNCGHRAQLYSSIDEAIEYSKAYHNNMNNPMDSLFGGGSSTNTLIEPKLSNSPEWSEKDRLEKEKEVLNFYISGHPLERFSPIVNSLATLSLGDKESILLGDKVRICGMFSKISNKLDRRNKPIAFAEIEDFSGKAECIFWSDRYEANKNYLIQDSVVMCIGKADLDNDKIKVIVDEVYPIAEAASKFAKGVQIWINLEKISKEQIIQFHNLCTDSQSKVPVVFNVFEKKRKYNSNYLADDVNLAFSEEKLNEIIKIFGRHNIRFIT